MHRKYSLTSAEQNIQFIVNVQHDCRDAKCETTGKRKHKQERCETDQDEYFLEHKSDDRFVVNLHAFHNAHLVRRALPRELTAPTPLFADRCVQHDEMAKCLRGIQGVKREATRKKREETKKRKADQAGLTGNSGLAETVGGIAKPKLKKQKNVAKGGASQEGEGSTGLVDLL